MPVVNVFLHGGLNSLATLVDRLKDDQMVLLVHGSGRITDILCYALDRAEKREYVLPSFPAENHAFC